MDARILKVVILTAAVVSLGANGRTPNFVVTAATPQLAQQIANAAEQYRRDLAIEWLGREMPTWAQPCPITVQVAENLGAGGRTSFLFEHGDVFGWEMAIQGSYERVLDSVLPHEVTHTIFATHFRRPLPRWADEGACTTVEHASERNKQQTFLIEFLKTGHGIAFNRMFAMKEYPRDVMPLYSQGYSVTRYLIAQGGRQKFLEFLGEGMQTENWHQAIQKHYGYNDLGNLQVTWLDWVRRGSPAVDKNAPALASNDRRSRPEPNLIYRAQSGDPGPREVRSGQTEQDDQVASVKPSHGWHPPKSTATSAKEAAVDANANHQVTRPQPVQKSRQIILEWSKPRPGSDS